MRVVELNTYSPKLRAVMEKSRSRGDTIDLQERQINSQQQRIHAKDKRHIQTLGTLAK